MQKQYCDGIASSTAAKPSATAPDRLAALSESERADYEERAAIREFDGGMSRTEAEIAALRDVTRELTND